MDILLNYNDFNVLIDKENKRLVVHFCPTGFNDEFVKQISNNIERRINCYGRVSTSVNHLISIIVKHIDQEMSKFNGFLLYRMWSKEC